MSPPGHEGGTPHTVARWLACSAGGCARLVDVIEWWVWSTDGRGFDRCVGRMWHQMRPDANLLRTLQASSVPLLADASRRMLEPKSSAPPQKPAHRTPAAACAPAFEATTMLAPSERLRAFHRMLAAEFQHLFIRSFESVRSGN